jgi:hypothetical protein
MEPLAIDYENVGIVSDFQVYLMDLRQLLELDRAKVLEL